MFEIRSSLGVRGDYGGGAFFVIKFQETFPPPPSGQRLEVHLPQDVLLGYRGLHCHKVNNV